MTNKIFNNLNEFEIYSNYLVYIRIIRCYLIIETVCMKIVGIIKIKR